MNGKPYGRRRADILRQQVLGVSVRAAERAPRQLRLTEVRRSLLEAVAAGKIRYYSSGWRSPNGGVSALVRECVSAGWCHEWIADGRPQIGLTTEGEKAIGTGEAA